MSGGDYESPDFQIRRTAALETAAGAAAVSAKFASFQKLKLKAIHTVVTVAGTSAGAGNSLVFKNGTTALATATLGTTTAGAAQSFTGLGADVASLAQLTATNGTDASGQAIVVYEYEVAPDAAFSA